jgi:hypothetical protein
VCDPGGVTVAALYIDHSGPYPSMAGVDCWDLERDARRYDGPYAVVAHPPCGPWSRLRHLYRGSEQDCAPRALEQVRAYGGVLEHPAHSMLWPAFKMPRPGELPDAHGGVAIEVDQVRWGHVARKRTWLYLVGVREVDVDPPARMPTHWASGSRSNLSGPVPEGIKVCSSTQRRRTPPAFAEYLVRLARRSTGGAR